MKFKTASLGIVILAAIVSIGFYVFANPFKSNTQIFTESLRDLASKSGDLTRNYQEEVGKWNMKELDNLTMVSITDRYLSQFAELENEAKALDVPNEYENIRDSFVSSVESEASSYLHFKNYLISGNKTEDQLSNDNLAVAFKQEMVYADFLSKHH
ncbi:MAG TPA: hypothetical protein VLD84_03050 [Nitrososphaeraceae archaeon]|nr:hypothetical protein [Nitrososphaeraceae archaeon]